MSEQRGPHYAAGWRAEVESEGEAGPRMPPEVESEKARGLPGCPDWPQTFGLN